MKIVVFQLTKNSSFVNDLRNKLDENQKDTILVNPKEEEYSTFLPSSDLIFIIGDVKNRLLWPSSYSSYLKDFEKVKPIFFRYPNKTFVLKGRKEIKKYWKAYEKENYLF
jgi:hypothetical protein